MEIRYEKRMCAAKNGRQKKNPQQFTANGAVQSFTVER